MSLCDRIQIRLENYWETIIVKTPEIALSLLIFFFFYSIAIFGARLFKRRLETKTSDNITVMYGVRIVKFAFICIGLVLAFHALGFTDIAGGILAGAGVGAIILGFAFKEIGQNFLAGIILVFDRPFNLGDTVTVNDNMGTIIELKFRTTHMKTFDGKDLYIPNSRVITEEVFNHTRDGFLRHDFLIGIDYDDDIDDARKTILETVNQHPEVLKEMKTQVWVDQFASSTVNLRILFWVHTKDYKISAMETKTMIMRDIKNVLLQNGFGLPANIQEIKLYKPEPIKVVLEENRSK